MLSIPLLLIINLIGLINGGQFGCPLSCDCTKDSVLCINKQLEFVPYFESLTNDPIIIDLSGNDIPYIDVDDFSFEKSDQVKEIYLNNTNINAIENFAFIELEYLQELYLADNLLTNLPDDLVLNNRELLLLDLSNNHFFDMPLIKSTSLQILELTNAGIANVPEDSLDYLTNLKILFLQQNNLKSINPIIFETMNPNFIVRLSFNPWKCDCKTVKLFRYLTIKNFTEIIEPVQCCNENREFIDIFDENGVTSTFEPICESYIKNENFFKMQEFFKSLDSEEDSREFTVQTQLNDNINRETGQNIGESDGKRQENDTKIQNDEMIYFYIWFLVASIPLNFILGVFIGSCITYRYMITIINRYKTESTKELMVNGGCSC